MAEGGKIAFEEIIHPMSMPKFLKALPGGVSLLVKVQPRASKNEIADPSGDELKIKVTAPPVDSAANEAVLRLLADTIDCPRSQIRLVRGGASRHKVVAIYGLSAQAVLAKLLPIGAK